MVYFLIYQFTKKLSKSPPLYAMTKLNNLLRFSCFFFLLFFAHSITAQTLQKDVTLDGGSSYVTSGSIDVGDVFTYRLQYTFPSTTTSFSNVVITDVLPPEVAYVSLANSPHTTGSYDSDTHTATFTFSDPISSGATGELLINVRFPSGTYTGSIADNNATMDADTGIGSPITTTPTVSVTATNGDTPPTISNGFDISKYNSRDDVSAGSGLYWTIRYGNLGGEILNNAIIEDCMPKEFVMSHWKFQDNFVGSINVDVYYKTWDNATCTENSTWQLWGTFATSSSSSKQIADLGLGAGVNIACMRFEFDPIPAGTNFHFDLKSRIEMYGDISTLYEEGVANDACGNALNVPAGGQTIINCADASATGASTSNVYTETNCENNTNILPDPVTYVDFEKDFVNGGPYSPGEIVRVELVIQSPPENTQDLLNPTIVDLLPPEMEFIGNVDIYTTGGGNPPVAVAPVFTAIGDYNGTGRTLLKWSWSSSNPYSISPNTLWEEIWIEFDVRIVWGTPNGDYTNNVRGWLENPSYNCQSSGDLHIDVEDIDGDGDTSETFCGRNEDFTVFKSGSGAGLDAQKWVKGECDSDWNRFPDFGTTVPGGKADYLLYVINPSDVTVKDIVLIDILPHIGDKGVIDLSNRQSQWQPVLADEVNAPAGVTVYYSTSDNPQRDELTPGLPIGGEDPNWSSIPPDDLTTVQSLKFDFGALQLAPDDTLTLTWAMRAPMNAPTNGEIAWNSFGYIATRADNGNQLLASEPMKVGIATKSSVPAYYGNYVWLDADKDGIQDVEEPGINGVRVELYQDDGDNVPEPGGDDVLWSFTITSNDGISDGKYIFPNLDPASYFAVFYPPNDYSYSPTNSAGDNSLDSDGTVGTLNSETVLITEVTDIVADETDLNWDQGFYYIYAPPLLGDFVWSELLCDGLQQAIEKGIAGIEVTLHDMENGGEEIGSSTTNSDGYYSFGGPLNENLYPVATTITNSIALQINNDSNDAEERVSSGTVTLSSSDIELGNDSGSPQYVGLRFENVAVPIGATITNAYLQFTADDDTNDFPQSGATTVYIKGELNSEPLTFSAINFNISNRTTTSDSVTWTIDPWNTAGEISAAQRSPDLTTLIQEIVDLGGWTLNNAMAFVIHGSGERESEAYNDVSSNAAQLFIEWEEEISVARKLEADYNYEIRIDLGQAALSNLDLTTPNVGSDSSNDSSTDVNDSDALEISGNAVIALTSDGLGTSNLGYDFGFCASTLVGVGNLVFLDKNDDGLFDADGPDNIASNTDDEHGIENITVELWHVGADGNIGGDDDGLLITDITDANGEYSFSNLAPEQYYLQITTLPSDYPTSSSVTDTNDNQQDNDDNGNQSGGSGTAIISPKITLTAGSEPTSDGNDNNQDYTVDFGLLYNCPPSKCARVSVIRN